MQIENGHPSIHVLITCIRLMDLKLTGFRIRYFGGTRYIFTNKFTSKKHAVEKIFKKKNMSNFIAYSR
jgi:hypothetical protein